MDGCQMFSEVFLVSSRNLVFVPQSMKAHLPV